MYEINIMENEEFDALPYKHAKSSLGMADAATGKAYIRRTGVEALDANTIRHEFDELLQSVSPHEEDGIRYKSGGGLGKILGPIVGGALSLFNPYLGAAVGAGITGGTGAHSRSVKPEKYGENTFGNVLKDAAIGGAGAYGAGSLLKGGIAGATSAKPGFFSKLGGGLKGAVGIGGGGAAAPVAAGNKTLSAAAEAVGQSVGAPIGTATAAGTGVTAGASAAGLATPLSGITGSAFGKGALKAIKTAGKSLATDTLTSSLAPPQSSAISGVGNYGGAQYGGTQGTDNILNAFGTVPKVSGSADTFQNPFTQEDYDKGVSRIDQTSARQTGGTFDQFRAAQPGGTIAGSSAFAKQLAAIEQGNEANIGALGSQMDSANEQAYQQFRYDGVKNANGLSDAKMTEYINLSRQPDEVIRRQFPGMTPSAFRAIFEGL